MATSSVVVVGVVVSYVYGEMRCGKTAGHILKNLINVGLQCCRSAVIKLFIFFYVLLTRFFTTYDNFMWY